MSETSSGAHDYELSEEQNVWVRSIGTHAIVWGTVCAIVALVCLVLAVLGFAGALRGAGWRLYFPVAVVHGVLAVNFVVAGRDFRAAVHRSGCDISHVMAGLRDLSRAVLVQIAVAIASVAVVVVAALLVGGL